MTSDVSASYRVIEIVHEVRIAAPREKVWDGLVGDLSAWWPKDFYMGEAPRAFHIENRVGGHMYEDWGDGQGMIWARVTILKRHEMLATSGELDGSCGGPGHTIQKYTLTSDGDETVLRLQDTLFGNFGDQQEANVAEGWKALLDGCLKPWVETGAQPDRPASVRP